MNQPRNFLDEYAITTMLASSPQRTVYRSLEPDTDRDVVVKLLNSNGASEDQIVRHHFLRAIGAIQFLCLPAFPEVLDFGFTDDSSAFMVMEWIDGESLTTFAGAPPQRVIPVLIQVTETLEALAMGEVYHHNLSPDNILVEAQIEGGAAKIVGFGTAAYFTGTMAGTLVGRSPEADRFIAPERFVASQDGTVGGAPADLYSLAMVTLDLLGGEVLESGDPGVRFSDGVRSALPETEILEEALKGALAMVPDERQTTFAILRNALERNLAPAEENGPPSVAEPPPNTASEALSVEDEDNYKTQVIGPDQGGSDEQGAQGELELETEPEPETELELETKPEPETELEPGTEPDLEPELEPETDPELDPEALESPTEADWTSETLVELPGPPPLPAAETGEPSAQEPVETPTSPPLLTEGPGEETTVDGRNLLLGHRDTGGLLEEDLIETGPVAFDPNKTDPLFVPKTPGPPPLPPKQAPRTEAVPADPAGRKSGLSFNRRLLVWAPVALVVIAAITFGLVMLRRLAPDPQPIPAPVTVVQPTPSSVALPPEEPVEAEVHPALEKADALLLEGDVEGARIVLAAITHEEIGNFSNDEAEAFRAMKDALEGSRLDAAVSDLEGGLQHGSIRMLKRGVAGLQRLNSEEFASRPEVSAMLKRAQAALHLHSLMWKAQEAQDYPLVMERSTAMIKALPNYSTGFKFREEAASALESMSDRAGEAGDHDRAKKLLESVKKHWPERRGLDQRFSAVNDAEQRQEKQRTDIEKALASGRAGDPEAGLALLNTVTPGAGLQENHSEALNLLRQQLAELDAQPPVVELTPETDLTFKKKKTVTIRLIITDDHRVAGATAYLKTAGATIFSKIELSLDDSTDSWSFEIGPETHRNDDFFLYVEATDVGGHTGRLGSSKAPLKVKRMKGLKALFSK
ncbi:MAG: protein kinase [Thermoanaerobaculales bacterium]|nr:protein kinase [Thermoanaerobaculales bacterium]